MKYLIVFTIFYIGVLFSLSAQNSEEEVVYMQDGSVIRGQIIERVPGDYIKIELMGGSVFILKEADIKEIKREDVKEVEAIKQLKLRLKRKNRNQKGIIAQRARGFYNAFDFHLASGASVWGWTALPPHLTYRFGFRFNKKYNVGMGIGINPYIEGGVIPVFVELNGVLGQDFKKAMPYYYTQIGYSEASWSRPWNANKFKGGPMFALGGGLKIHTRSRLAWLFTGGIKYQSRSFHEMDWISSSFLFSNNRTNINSASFVFGIGIEI